MFKSLNRGISTLIAIIIIVVCALLVGGIVVWQYYGMPKEEEETPGTTKPPEETDKCENIQDSIDREICYVAKAIETSNEEYCNYTSIVEDECWNYLAVLKNKPELCREFGERWCVDYVFLQNTDLCKEISIDAVKYDIACIRTEFKPYLSIKQSCQNLRNSVDAKKECIKKIALETENMELCKNLFDLSNNCQNDLAIKLNDPQKCSNYKRDDCITEIAIKNKDAEICKEATNVAKCVGEIAKIFPEEIGEVEEILLKDEVTGWNIYRNLKYGFEFKYPDYLFWWEPEVKISDCDHVNFPEECPNMAALTKKILPSDQPQKRPAAGPIPKEGKIIINDAPFCYRITSDAAAGTGYTSYYYTTIKKGKCLTMYFIIARANCGHYDEDEREACEDRNSKKGETFNEVLSTFKFTD